MRAYSSAAWMGLVMSAMGCAGSGGSTADTQDTPTTPVVTTGTATATGGETSTSPSGMTDAAARIVHVAMDLGAIELWKTDPEGATTNTGSIAGGDLFPAGGNSDSYGLDYLFTFPSSSPWFVRDATGQDVLEYEVTFTLGEFHTVLIHGSQGVELVAPGLGLGPMAQTIDDDVSAASPGMHRLTVFHVNPFFPAANIRLDGGAPETVMYGAWTTATEVPAGSQQVGLDVMGPPPTTTTGTAPPMPPLPDGTDDFTITTGELEDGGWSYIYVTYGYPEDPPLALHHVRTRVNTPLLVAPVP